MSKCLAITYDDQSFVFDEKFLAIVTKAQENKTPIRFPNGTQVSGADIRRVEKEHQDLYETAEKVFLPKPNIETDHTGIFPPKFWRTVWNLNTIRIKSDLRFIRNDEVECIFYDEKMVDPLEIFKFIDATTHAQ